MKPARKPSNPTRKNKTKISPRSKQQRPTGKTLEGIQRLVHSLEVYQVELEHQNQELRYAEEELEASRNRYLQLFDFSPIPYVVLDLGGVIIAANLRASTVLGMARNRLVGKHFGIFIPPKGRDVFMKFMKAIVDSAGTSTCKVELITKDKRTLDVLMEGSELVAPLESDRQLQVALIDLTEYQKM